MSTQETVTPGGNYVPPDQRADIGKATEDRRREQIRADNLFQPIMPQEPEHRFDKRIEQLEAEVRRQKRDKEFSQLETVQQRELHTLKQRREADERQAEYEEAQSEWLKEVAPQLTRLAELRDEFTSSDGVYNGSDVAEIDKCIAQHSKMGACKKTAAKMLTAIEEKYQACLEQQQFELDAQVAGLRNRISALEAKRKKPEPEQTIDDPDLEEFKAHKGEVQAALDAGDPHEAERLRSVYWSNRAKRGRV